MCVSPKSVDDPQPAIPGIARGDKQTHKLLLTLLNKWRAGVGILDPVHHIPAFLCAWEAQVQPYCLQPVRL